MKGEMLALAAALLWGLAPVLDKFALSRGVSIYAANLVRMLGAMIVLAAASFAAKSLSVDARAAAYLLTAGALGGAIAMLLYYSALLSAPVSRVVAITATYPMFTAVLSAILLGESVGLRCVMGILFIVLGIVLVSEV